MNINIKGKERPEMYRSIPGVDLKDINIKEAAEFYKKNGYFLVRGMFDKKESQEASNWLRSQDLEKLSKKEWPDWEPGNQMSMYQNVHKIDSPISKIAAHPDIEKISSQLTGDDVYIWSSKVNFKAAWCGSVDYYHQDYSTYKERGYPHMEMLNVFICLDPHGSYNAGLYVFPGSHKEFIDHMEFINVNGIHKLMIPPKNLDTLFKTYGVRVLEAEPGDTLFFHSALVHGSSHNYSPYQRMIILTQLNTRRNKPQNIHKTAREYNLHRAKYELENAKRLYDMAKKKYETQLKSEELTFNTPIPKDEY